jgi:hypothetical protein
MAWICVLSLHGNYAVPVVPSLLLMPFGYGMSFAPMYTQVPRVLPPAGWALARRNRTAGRSGTVHPQA